MSLIESGLCCPNCNEPLRDLNLKICPYCGVKILNQEENTYLLKEKDIFETINFDPENIWLFINPVAKANHKKYKRSKR